MQDNNNESMVRYLIIEILESAFNLALSYDADALSRLRPFAGHVIRLKTDREDFSFYCELGEAGVLLFADHEGPISARVRMPSGLLARYLLGMGRNVPADLDAIRINGDQQLVMALFELLNEFSLLTLCKRIIGSWLPDFENLDDLLNALRSHDPAWLTRLEHLPQLVNESMVALREQAELQRQQMRELVAIRSQLDADRRASQISTVIGLCLIVVAFMAHNGYLQFPQLQIVSLDTAIMLIVAMVLLIPRMMRRKR